MIRCCSLVLHECPCGFHTHPKTECTCSPSAVVRYQRRVSGPLLDRIDVFVEVPPVEYEKLVDEEPAEDSEKLRQRVEQARDAQHRRFRDFDFLCNSEMGPAEVWKFCPLDDTAKGLLQAATQRLNLSARAFHRILKDQRGPPGRSAAVPVTGFGVKLGGCVHPACERGYPLLGD